MTPADFRRIARSLDGVEEGVHAGLPDFRVGGRKFASLASQSQGYGNLMLTLEQQAAFVEEAREDTVNFMVNGINMNDPNNQQVTFQPTINTVDEFIIDNSTFSAEYGRNSGSIVNVATRPGVNTWHGEAYNYMRNNDLDARNFSNPTHTTSAGRSRRQPAGAVHPQSVWRRQWWRGY